MAETAAALASPLADRYGIERELARGGMAAVYVADDRKHGRKVAIKVLQAELVAPLGAARFLREIRIAARLTHPHILPLIDSGEAGGLLYYVMPLVPEGSLRQRLAPEPPLPLPEAIPLARDVRAARDYAPPGGLVPPDLEPQDILVARR